MKQPLWKKWLSYISELHIESVSSEYNPHLYVSLREGRYQLCTANAIYSFEDLYDNFGEAFKKIDLEKLSIERVLILGFGLASVPLILEKKHNKKYHYTGVEIDEEVLYLANKYVMDELSSSFDLVCTDAFLYALQCEKQFDLVIMDVFCDDLIPLHFENEDFLNRLQEMTKPDGLIMYNRLAFNEKDIEHSKKFYEEHFSQVFDKGTYIEVKGNWMLLNRSDVLK